MKSSLVITQIDQFWGKTIYYNPIKKPRISLVLRSIAMLQVPVTKKDES